jgi:nucleoside-diphosphate-sugar epimerase
MGKHQNNVGVEMGKILIIGCGYLGSHLANYYRRNGWDVKIAGRSSIYVSHLDPEIEFFEIDITDSDQLHCIIEQDDLVLCATGSINATNGFDDVTRDISEYYISFVNLLNECANKRISKFVFLSSAGTVYGDVTTPARETDSLNPLNIYGLQKVYFENLIKIKQSESNRLPYIILRVSNPYGGFQNPCKNQGIIPVLINRAILREQFVFWGDVNSTRDFIYIDDFLKATYLSTIMQTNEVINIASGVGTTIKDVIEIVQEKVGCDIRIVYKTSNNKILMHNRVDISKLKRVTEYSPSTTIEKGISMMVQSIVSAME